MSSKLKVLVIPSWYPSKENPIWGNYLIKQAEALNEYCDVSMLYVNRIGIKKFTSIFEETKTDGLNDKLYSFKFYKKTILNIKTISMNLAFYLYCRALYKSYKRYMKIVGKPNIILAQSALPAGLGALYLSKKTKIPFVVHAHSVDVMKNKDYKKYIQKVVNTADGYMAVSKMVQEELKNYGRRDSKIVNNFIDTKKFNVKLENNSDFVLISICNFFRIKALEVLIHAMDIIVNKMKIKDIKLKIVGTGEFEGYYKSIAKNLKLDNYVEFTGYVPNDKLPCLISKSNVVCVSSRSETFGIPIVEGFSAGIPAISTDCGGPTEIINDKTGIIVPVDNPEEYAKAIINMKKNYSKYDGNYIRQYAYENYDKEVVCKKMIEVFKDVIRK